MQSMCFTLKLWFCPNLAWVTIRKVTVQPGSVPICNSPILSMVVEMVTQMEYIYLKCWTDMKCAREMLKYILLICAVTTDWIWIGDLKQNIVWAFQQALGHSYSHININVYWKAFKHLLTISKFRSNPISWRNFADSLKSKFPSDWENN